MIWAFHACSAASEAAVARTHPAGTASPLVHGGTVAHCAARMARRSGDPGDQRSMWRQQQAGGHQLSSAQASSLEQATSVRSWSTGPRARSAFTARVQGCALLEGMN